MAADDESTEFEPRDYRLIYRVTPPTSCPLTRLGEDVRDISVFRTPTEARCDFVVREGDRSSVKHHRRSLEQRCPCSVFFDIDAVPHVSPSGTDLTITTYVDDPENGYHIAEQLHQVSPDVSLLDVKRVVDDPADMTACVDLSTLTKKQHRAVTIALEDGYYRTPSETTIDEMAARTDISSSAFATRLRHAEQAIAEQLHEGL